jgi:hypothetical protein
MENIDFEKADSDSEDPEKSQEELSSKKNEPELGYDSEVAAEENDNPIYKMKDQNI